jgi:PAS domain S-box-containing protein
MSLKFLNEEAWLPSTILEDVEVGLIVADARNPDMPIVYVNAGCEKITGYSSDDFVGKNCRFLQGTESNQPQVRRMRDALRNGRACKVILRNFRKDGSAFWNDVRLTPLFDRNGTLTHYAGFLGDVTESRDALLKAQWHARFDPRTGLLNRQGSIDELNTMLAADPQGDLAVATCQLEGLLDIANTVGEEFGDALVRIAAQRVLALPSVVSTARLPFGRLLMIIQAEQPSEIMETLLSALEALEEPYVVFDTSFALAPTCGYTLLGGRRETAENLVREAATASTGAREQGPGSINEFSPAADKALKSRIRLMSDLQTAIRDNELILHYQPKVDLLSGLIVGAEALLRWEHALFGIQPPSRFLPMAEKSNMISEIGRRSLTNAAIFATRINRTRPGAPFPIAVNISPTHFKHDSFVSELCDILSASDAQPEWISLELIETVLAEATPAMIRNFAELREMGVGIAVDDFGVGYSNLTYLRDFPLTELKIDQTFVRGVESSPANAAIVRAVVGMAREFGLKVVAEGIETEAEHDSIVGLGCLLGQGYYYSVPVEADILEAMLTRPDCLPVGLENRRASDA